MPSNQATFSFAEYGNKGVAKPSNFSVNIGPLTAANFTAKRDAIDDLKGTLPGLTRGVLRKTAITENFAESNDEVTNPEAQREDKWLVTYRDVTQFLDVGNTINNVGFGNLYQVEIPTADRALLEAGSDELDITPVTGNAAALAFITAFEAVQNSPTGGNEIEVTSIRYVGRGS